MKFGIQVVAAALAISLCVADSAFARGRHGSCGSSGGSYGSCGSSGSSGSSGSCGSSGSRGSRGSRGSSGSHGSCGSSGGSYGSHGSSGGVVYYTTPVAQPTCPTCPINNCPNGQCVQPVTTTVVKQAYAQMVFHVPAKSVIYLVGQKMTNSGDLRTFNSPVLKDGQKFGYPIRVELEHDGKTFKAEGTQMVRAGDRVELKVDFDVALGQLSMVQADGQASVLELVQVAQQSEVVAQN